MVTAIIVNYHSRLLTVRAAASVLADQPNAQVIVIDNSEDGFEAGELAALLPSQVEYIVSPQNIGFGRACNLGYERARYEWVFLLNPDAFVVPGCIAELVAFLRQTPRAGAAAPLAHWDTAQQWLLPPALLPTPATELVLVLALARPWLGRLVSQRFRSWALRCLRSEHAVAQRMLSGGHMLLRRSAVEAAGGLFDPAFFMYFEDTDLCMRLHKAGFQLYLVPAARAVHAWEAAPEKTAPSLISRRQYFRKQFPGSLLFALMEKLERHGLRICLQKSRELGLCSAPLDVRVPPRLHSQWILEVSPHPLFVPALYCFGTGDSCRLSDEIWALIGAGDYWARIAAPSGLNAETYHWLKKD